MISVEGNEGLKLLIECMQCKVGACVLTAHLDEKLMHGASARARLSALLQVGPTTAFSASHFEYRCCGMLWEDEQSNLFPSTSGILWYVEGAAAPKRTTSNQWRQSGMLLDPVVEGKQTEVVAGFLSGSRKDSGFEHFVTRWALWEMRIERDWMGQRRRFITYVSCRKHRTHLQIENFTTIWKLQSHSLLVPSHREVLLRHRTSSVKHLIRTRSCCL